MIEHEPTLCFICFVIFQLKTCRVRLLGRRAQDVLALEHKVIRSVIARPQQHGGFALCIGWTTKVKDVDHVYIRSISQGTLEYFPEDLIESNSENVIHDKVVTRGDVQRFRLQKSRSRSTDIQDLFKDFKDFSSRLNADEFACACYINKDNDIFSCAYGSKLTDTNLHTKISCAIASNGKHMYVDDAGRRLLLQKPSLTLKEQIDVLNTIPAQCAVRSTDRKQTNKLTLSKAWHMLSPKYVMINAPTNIAAIETAFEAVDSCSPVPRETHSTGSQKRRSRSRDIVSDYSRLDSVRRLKMLTATDAFPIQHAQTQQLSHVCFQQALMSKGHIRVLTFTPNCIKVLWNKFDAVSSKLHTASLAYSFMFHLCSSSFESS
jgi:hypothetical protein